MHDQRLDDLIHKVAGMHKGNAFRKFIDYIVFPKYRNLEPGLRINFGFPLTVLVGQNGAGKTSVLQALDGAPEGRSVGNYWFETAVDQIDRQEAQAASKKRQKFKYVRQAFWYGYKHRNDDESVELRQALKTRIREPDNPDYWEPSRPIKSYGMTLLPGKERWPQIEMDAVLIQMRFKLNAFDRCFHFVSPSTLRAFKREHQLLSIPRVQDYLRYRARGLKKAIETHSVINRGGNEMNRKVEPISAEALKIASRLIGKDYTAATAVEHRFYESWAETIRFQADNLMYSEAYAGAGETAVMAVVREVLRPGKGRLILIDEPETALHPGAQRELLVFLLQQIVVNQHQIILSTHSPELIQGLPSSAIKVLVPTTGGRVQIEEDRSPEEAFFRVGHLFNPGTTIIVEDRLAKAVVERAIQARGDAFSAKFRVEFRPGGDSEMKKDIAVFSQTDAVSPIFLFDGDKRADHIDPETLALAVTKDAGELDKIIKEQTGRQIRFSEDSNMDGGAQANLRMKYLRYYFRNVKYLPYQSPDDGLWSEEFAVKLIEDVQGSNASLQAALKKELSLLSSKARFAKVSERLGLPIDSIHTLFLNRHVADKRQEWNELVKLIGGINAPV